MLISEVFRCCFYSRVFINRIWPAVEYFKLHIRDLKSLNSKLILPFENFIKLGRNFKNAKKKV